MFYQFHVAGAGLPEASPSSEWLGVQAILWACALNVGVAAGFYYAGQVDTHCPPLTAVTIRIFANALGLLPAVLRRQPLPRVARWSQGRELWLWGLFGCLTVIAYYEAVARIGAGRTTLLNTGGGILIVALAPLLAHQRLQVLHLVAAVGCTLGMALLSEPGALTSAMLWGCGLATASGLFSAVAYLMIARGGTRHSTESIVLHWTVVNLLVVGGLAWIRPVVWPSSVSSWSLLIAVGAGAAVSQYLTALAYQRARASMVACLSFSGPMLSLLVDHLLFHIRFSLAAWVGVSAILICGLGLPVGSLLLSWSKTNKLVDSAAHA